MLLADFHFLYPLWFLLLPVLIGFILWLKNIQNNTTVWDDFIDEKLRPYVLSTGTEKSNKIFLISLALAGMIAILALAGPSWDKRTVPAFQTQQGLVVAMDLSTSMLLDDITPSRLVRSRFKLIDLLKLRKEGQTGLVVFAGAAFAVSPLTNDAKNIIEQVKYLGPGIMPSQGSRVDFAIDQAALLLKQSNFKKGHILLITDGLANLEKSIERAQKAKEQGYKVSILAVGTEKGATIPLSGGRVYTKQDGTPIIASLNEAQLKQVATAGGGYYQLSALSDADIQYFHQQFSPKNHDELNNDIMEKKDREIEYWNNKGIYLSLLLLPFVLLLFRRGVLFSVLLLMFLLPQSPTANAYEWEALWKNENQRGQIAFNNQQADKAVKLFKRPDWQAAAAYKNKDYKKASELYAQFNTADADYNRANALAKLKKYDQAIKAYDQALSKNSHLQDAIDNKKLVQQLKKQQQKQENKDNQQNDQQDKSKKQQDKQNNIKDKKGEQEQPTEEQKKQQKEKDAKEKKEKEKQDKQEKGKSDKDKKKDAENIKDPAQQHGRQGKESEQSKQEKRAERESKEELRKMREENQRTDQWLRKIPDDSAGLWRRKFLYQYRRRSDARGRGNQQPW